MQQYPPIIKDMPHMLHGGDYNPEQWLAYKDAIWEEDMRLAKLAHINTLSVGIFSWTQLEKEDGVYTFGWLDEVMDKLAENGMKAVLATPSGARPAWLAQKYPEVLRVTADRHPMRYGERHNHCPSSPEYRRKVASLNEALADRYKDHPALGLWHVSNEYGGDCHCPLCQERFRAFLKKRYGTLEALNAAWWTAFWSHTYTDWSQIESPGPYGEQSLPALNLSWKRFTTEQYIDFYRAEVEPLKRITPDVPCTTNFMRFFTTVDYYRFARELDVVCWDNYPRIQNDETDWQVFCETSFQHDWFRGMLGKPFLMMESSPSATNWQPVGKLRRPGVTELIGQQAIAHGSDSVQYFQFRKGRGSSEQFHGAVVDHVGHEDTRVFAEVAQTGADIARLDAVVGAAVPAKAALLFDVENLWALQYINGYRNVEKDKGYEKTVLEHYRALRTLGVDVDVVDSTYDLTGYALVSAPMLFMLRPGMAEKLEAFVRAGGVLLTTYMTGTIDEEGLCFTGGFPGPLMETTGVWQEEVDSLYDGDANSFIWRGKTYRADLYCELVHLRGAQTQAQYQQDFYAGFPALTCRDLGKGRAYHLACHAEEAFLLDF